MDGHITVTEAAHMLGTSTRTVRRWVQAGILPGVRIPGRGGGEIRIPREAVDHLLAVGIVRDEQVGFETVARCQGTNKAGKPCQGLAVTGTRYCRHHQDQERTK